MTMDGRQRRKLINSSVSRSFLQDRGEYTIITGTLTSRTIETNEGFNKQELHQLKFQQTSQLLVFRRKAFPSIHQTNVQCPCNGHFLWFSSFASYFKQFFFQAQKKGCILQSIYELGTEQLKRKPHKLPLQQKIRLFKASMYFQKSSWSGLMMEEGVCVCVCI